MDWERRKTLPPEDETRKLLRRKDGRK